MEKIATQFAADFAPWNMTVPAAALQSRARGVIQEAGWSIQYLFDRDERGEYLDYYASHRMTSERHVRLYADGTRSDLPAQREFIVYPAGATAAQQQQADAEYYAYNQQVAADLARKGFR